MPDPLPTRRSFCAALGLAAVAARSRADEPPRDVTYPSDFDELWRTLGDRYCYFDTKRVDWAKVRATYRPAAAAAGSRDEFADVIRRVLAELYDPHTHLADPPAGAPRWPLYDLLVAVERGEVQVRAVEPGSAAADAGIRVGDRILAVEGMPIDRVVADLMPRCLLGPDPASEGYALNVAVAGRRGRGRRLTVRSVVEGVPRVVDLPIKPQPNLPDLEVQPLVGGLGRVAIRSFAADATVAAFDRALDQFRDAPGLILDVRGNGGGDTAVARPIMGRFTPERRPYARMRRRAGAGLGAPWTEWVEPRGASPWTRPVVVLVDPWSASMAEGFPMGMRAVAGARVVGTRMMGLGAAVFPLRLDRTGLQVQYSAEPVFDINDIPRQDLRPDVEVTPGDDILAAGITELHRLIARG